MVFVVVVWFGVVVSGGRREGGLGGGFGGVGWFVARQGRGGRWWGGAGAGRGTGDDA